MTAAKTAQFDAGALRRAMEDANADLLTGLFRDDAECIVIDRNHTPSEPLRRLGKSQIAEYNENLLGPGKTHRVEGLVVAGDGAAFADACRYDDGTRVHCNAFLDLEDGRITRMVAVQAWDE